MFYSIYDVPSFVVVALFVTIFVGACFLGTLFLRPRRRWVHEGGGSNEILGDFLQYFGVIYGLLLGLLAVATKTTRMPKRLSATKHQLSPQPR